MHVIERHIISGSHSIWHNMSVVFAIVVFAMYGLDRCLMANWLQQSRSNMNMPIYSHGREPGRPWKQIRSTWLPKRPTNVWTRSSAFIYHEETVCCYFMIRFGTVPDTLSMSYLLVLSRKRKTRSPGDTRNWSSIEPCVISECWVHDLVDEAPFDIKGL